MIVYNIITLYDIICHTIIVLQRTLMERRSTDNKILVTLNKATLNCLLKKVEKNQLTLQLKHCHQ